MNNPPKAAKFAALMKKTILSYSLVCQALLFVLLTGMLASCANIIPPGGGPRDSLPPRLYMATPRDSSVNMSITTKTIVLTFDEYIGPLQEVQKNLIVSPTTKNMPIVDARLRNLTIRFRDTLDTNTTYRVDFGDAVRDVNENNIARGFSYVFSTGKTIDTNTYRGRVVVAETGSIDSALIVVLHNNLADSAIYKLRPRYYARVTGKGEFMFHNLPAGNFAAYVVPDDFMRRYDDSTKMFAFLDHQVNTRAGSNDTFYAYQEFKREIRANTNTASRTTTGNNKDKEKEDKRLRYSHNLEGGRQDLLGHLQLTFNRKLTTFDSAAIRLTDTLYRPLTGYRIELDTARTGVHIYYAWQENTPLRLKIEQQAVADSAGVTLTKADTLRFSTQRESDYGSLRLRFGNIDLSRKPVLQFVQNEKLEASYPLTQKEFYRRLYKPGVYTLRILYDTNGNGIWDPGSFKGKRQPEKVELIGKQLSIRANWDNEVEVSL